MNHLTITNLTKFFGSGSKKQVIFDEANASWEEGYIHGIVGANGSGKSTLLKLICSLTTPTSGRISLPPTLGPLGFKNKSKVVYLSPNAGLHKNLTVRENIKYFAKVCADMTDTPTVDSTIKSLDLEAHQDKLASEISTGTIQRARIGQCLSINPKILLLDEPTSGLDIEAKSSVYKTLSSFRKNNKLVLIATHDISEICSLCDSVSLVAGGKIHQNISLPNHRDLSTNIESIYSALVKEIA